MLYLCTIVTLSFLAQLAIIFKKDKIMAVLSDFQVKLDRITTGSTTLSSQVGELTAEVTSLTTSLTSKMSDADEQSVLGQLDTIGATLENISASITSSTTTTTTVAQS